MSLPDQSGRDQVDQQAACALPWYPWYCRDFLASTRGWSVTARGVYRELLDASWDNGPLAADPKALRKLIGATPSEWKIGWPLVEPKFPVHPDGLRRNARLEKQRQNALQKSAVRAEAGRRGGRAKAARIATVTHINGLEADAGR